MPEYRVKLRYEFICEAEDEREALKKAIGGMIADTGTALGRWLTGRDQSLEEAIRTSLDFEVQKENTTLMKEGKVLSVYLVGGQVVVIREELPKDKSWSEILRAVASEIGKDLNGNEGENRP